jgi:hypothetical protein
MLALYEVRNSDYNKNDRPETHIIMRINDVHVAEKEEYSNKNNSQSQHDPRGKE